MMKRWKTNWRYVYELTDRTCLCCGLLLLLKYGGSLAWPDIFLLAGSLLLLSVIDWSEEKSLRLPVWAGISCLALLAGLALYWKGRELSPYLHFLGMEAVCLVTAVACYQSRRRLWLRSLLVLAEFTALIVYGIRSIPLPKWAVCIILLSLILYFARVADNRPNEKYRSNVLHLTPVFAFLLFIIFLLPVKTTPIRWTAVRQILHAARDTIYSLAVNIEYHFSGGEDFYSLSFSGFGDDGELGGDVRLSSQVQLTLLGSKTYSPVYLAGSVRDTYTGVSWEQKLPMPDSESVLQKGRSNRLLEALSQSIYTEKEIQEMTRFCSMDIRYAGLKTKSLFSARNTERFLFSRQQDLLFAPDGRMSMSKPAGVGFQYEIQFMEADYSGEKMIRLLRQQAWKDENDVPALEPEEIAIHDSYTLLPDTLPGRVYELAASLTQQEDNDYDRLKAIENYLNTYSYTTSPDPCPEGQDFTDYFLFDSRNGYCTYFATALAVLGRCAGIPTRYVEGFVTASPCRYDHRSIDLTGANAHAWVEAYIDHIGWITLDPTPGYYISNNTAWIPAGKKLPVPTAGAEDLRPDIPENSASDSLTPERGFSITDLRRPLIFILKIGAAAALLTALLILFLAVRSAVRRRSYKARSDYDKMLYLIGKTLRHGRRYGLSMESGETLAEYAGRLKGRLDTPSSSFSSICALYQSVRFGGCPIDGEDLKLFENYVSDVGKQYLKGCGRIRRLLYYLQ